MIAYYARVSTQEQAVNGHSIGEQIERMQDFCKAMQWTDCKEYVDAGFSGAKTDRPSLQRLIQDVKAGKISRVLVYKLDRLSRSQKDTLYLIEDVFLANGCDFVSMSENFDTSTPFGRAMIGILAVFAQLEREQIKERMTMGKEARAKQGKYGGGSAVPIGYDYVDGELIINAYEKMQILRIFDLFLSGTSIREISNQMNLAGYRHKHGTWNTHTVRNVLGSKTLCGYIKYAKEWHKGTHEPIITEETHDKVTAILQERSEKHRNGGRRAKITSYLGGLLYCKRCGAKLTKLKSGSGQRNYYICNSRAKKTRDLIKDPDCKLPYQRMEELDSLILSEIKKLSVDPDYFDQLTDADPETESPEILETEISKIDSQISKLIDLYALGSMPMDMLDAKLHDLNQQKKSIEQEIIRMQEDRSKLSRAETLKAVESFGDILERGSFAEIRLVIETLIDRIDVDADEITIQWRFN